MISFCLCACKQDTTAPSLVDIPSDVTVQCNAIPSVSTIVNRTDMCDPNPSLSFQSSRSNYSSSCLDNYTIWRTWSTADGCGNIASATQTILVEDSHGPAFQNLISSASITCENVWQYNLSAVGLADNCDPTPQLTTSQSRRNGMCAFDYVLTQQFTGVDRCGNTVESTRIVTVTVSCVFCVLGGVLGVFFFSFGLFVIH